MEKEALEAVIERFRRAARESARRADHYEGTLRAMYLGKSFAFCDCANMLEAFAQHPEWEEGLRALEAVLRNYHDGYTYSSDY